MFRRVLLLATALCMIAAPTHAQFVVIDPANLVQTTLIAYRVQQHYTELRAQYLTVLRMAQRLGSLDRYRTPPIAAHLTRSGSVGLRAAVDSGAQQRRSHRLRVLLNRASAPSPDDDTPNVERRGKTDAAAAVRHHRDHRLGGDDGRPPGRVWLVATTASCRTPSSLSRTTS